MAPQQEGSKGGAAIAAPPAMEEEEDEEEHRRHSHGERPLLSACAQEEQERDASKPLPLPAKRRRRRSLSRSSRSGEQEDGATRSLSFSRLFSSFRMIAAAAAVDIDQDQLAAAEDGRAALNPHHHHHHQPPYPKPVCRTQSLPMTSISRRLPAPHGHHRKRVADSSSLRRFRVSSSLSSAPPVPLPESESSPPSSPLPSPSEEEEGEEVGEEEAVCRICMVALCEEEDEEEEGGGDGDGDGVVLKLECRCKGELALAHRRCALRWFGIKGNANCDVCGHDVLNLPVTLRRLPIPPPPPPPTAGNNGGANQEGEGGGERRGLRGVWRHGTVILVVVSMLAYFCFLEQLLVGDHGSNAAAALAVSVPFAVVLGTFSALTTAGMVSSRRYVWAYSALQFLLVVLFTHLFYRYVKLQAVIAIILSTFAGFGVAICTNAVLLQAIRWKAAADTARRPSPDHHIPQP
ncbi:hypothetical protein ZWY2020_015191 [Hordeum vulgare]|nr:hypothetical protein ZWY2020_015191 [Hordeum vulgare]